MNESPRGEGRLMDVHSEPVEDRIWPIFCRMVLPEPAVRQIIAKSIETLGRTVKIDPLRSVVNGS